MSIAIRLPTPLRPLVDNQRSVNVTGATVGDALAALGVAYPAIKSQLYTERGELKNYINVFLNDEKLALPEGVAHAVKAGDELRIVPAVAGGSIGRR